MDFLLWLKLSIAILFALGIDNIFWVPWDRNWIKWQNRWKFDNEEIKFYKNWKKTFGYRFLYIVDFKIYLAKDRFFRVIRDPRDILASTVGGLILTMVF